MSELAVIIPARNAAHFIPLCLDGLRRAGIAVSQITVVDDASTDATAAAARAGGVHVLQRSACGGAAVARNEAAADLADAALLLFVDADVIVAPDAVDRLMACLEREPEVAAAFGSYDDNPVDTTLVSSYRNLLHHTVHQAANRDAVTFWTGFGLIRREVFIAHGGFDVSGRFRPIEDVEFGSRLKRAGRTIRLDRDALCRHAKSWSLAEMVRSDIVDRALPWSRLLLSSRAVPNDLNVGYRQRVNLALTGLFALGLAATPWAPLGLAAAAAAAAGIVMLDRNFFAFLVRRRGLLFAIGSVPLHLLHYACACAGLALALIVERPRMRTIGAAPPRFAKP